MLFTHRLLCLQSFARTGLRRCSFTERRTRQSPSSLRRRYERVARSACPSQANLNACIPRTAGFGPSAVAAVVRARCGV